MMHFPLDGIYVYNRAKRAAFTTIPNKWKAFRGYSIAARGSMSMAPKGS